MIYALAVICLAQLGCLLYVLRSHEKQDEVKEAAWRLERVALLNRIQAPEAAPFMDPTPSQPGLQYVPFEDDDAFHEAQHEMAA